MSPPTRVLVAWSPHLELSPLQAYRVSQTLAAPAQCPVGPGVGIAQHLADFASPVCGERSTPAGRALPWDLPWLHRVHTTYLALYCHLSMLRRNSSVT